MCVPCMRDRADYQPGKIRILYEAIVIANSHKQRSMEKRRRRIEASAFRRPNNGGKERRRESVDLRHLREKVGTTIARKGMIING